MVKEEVPDHKRGPIHVQVAMEFLEAQVEAITDEDAKQTVQDWMKGLEAEDATEVADTITIFRTPKTNNADARKLQICITDNDNMKIIHTALAKLGAKLKADTPPRTEQRAIQKALDRKQEDE